MPKLPFATPVLNLFQFVTASGPQFVMASGPQFVIASGPQFVMASGPKSLFATPVQRILDQNDRLRHLCSGFCQIST